MTPWLPYIVALSFLTGGVVTYRVRRAQRARRARRLEAPNSEYKSPYVLELEAKERWEGIALDRLHQVNREEVQRLHKTLADGGVRALSGSEKAFLDRMVDALRRTAPRRS
jgi:hypothetical protein